MTFRRSLVLIAGIAILLSAGVERSAWSRQDRILGLPSTGDPRRQAGFAAGLGAAELTPEDIAEIDEQLLDTILEIDDPSPRSFALIRAARYKIQLGDFETAESALDQAGESALQVEDPLTRDLRLQESSDGYTDLAEEALRSSLLGVGFTTSLDPEPDRPSPDRLALAERAFGALNKAARLSASIDRDSYRANALYNVVAQFARSSQEIGVRVLREGELPPGLLESRDRMAELADEFLVRGAEIARTIEQASWRDTALVAVVSAAASSGQFARSDTFAQSILSPQPRFEAYVLIAEGKVRTVRLLWTTALQMKDAYRDFEAAIEADNMSQARTSFNNLVDQVEPLLRQAETVDPRAELNRRIADRAGSPSEGVYEEIAAAAERVIDLGRNLLDVLGRIDQRIDVFRDDRPEEADLDRASRLIEELEHELFGLIQILNRLATPSYQMASEAIASISIVDLRGTLANVLIESLILSGRFVDARRAIAYYADNQKRMAALGAIAESMGARGLAPEARSWIRREIRPAYRGELLRRVNEGVLSVLKATPSDPYSGSLR